MGKYTGGQIETGKSKYMHAYKQELTDELES